MKKNINILLIDEEVAEEQSFNTILTELNLKNLTQAKTSIEGIELHKEKEFDLTFFNGQMSDMPGLELLKKITDLRPNHYLVMLMDVASPDTVKSAIQLGASGILNKPFTSKKVLYEIEKFSLLKEDRNVSYKAK